MGVCTIGLLLYDWAVWGVAMAHLASQRTRAAVLWSMSWKRSFAKVVRYIYKMVGKEGDEKMGKGKERGSHFCM